MKFGVPVVLGSFGLFLGLREALGSKVQFQVGVGWFSVRVRWWMKARCPIFKGEVGFWIDARVDSKIGGCADRNGQKGQ